MGLFLDVLFLVFGVGLVAICVKRGLILTLIKFLKMTFSVAIANLLGGTVGTLIGEMFLNASIRDSVYKQVSKIYADSTGGLTTESSMGLLPSYLQTEAMQEKLGAIDATGDTLVNTVTDTISESISSVVCGIVGFVLVLILAFLALSVVYLVIKRYKKLFKEFGLVDSICGGLLGLIFAWIVLMFVSSIIKFFCGDMPIYNDSTIAKFFGESSLLENSEIFNINSWLNKG